MMLKSWSSIEEVPYCFSSSSMKFKVTRDKYRWFWAELRVFGLSLQFEFTDGLKWFTKLEVAWKRCPIVCQGHPSNFKVTQDRKSPILTQIERFCKFEGHMDRKMDDLNPILSKNLSWSQLSNLSDLQCLISFFLKLIVACRLCVICVGEDSYSNV